MTDVQRIQVRTEAELRMALRRYRGQRQQGVLVEVVAPITITQSLTIYGTLVEAPAVSATIEEDLP